ncbi:hypothetical protein [Desulfovibrio sp. UCD-KL4C]|uniref:hypothetical protein n=1 Tax=Desulfovibrio sp. UCD-KL4C TaxID=2578120 RepID=UPI0025BBF3E4|nr:hypothetical protein [Desulfovibrio sp. UCD-KL4C]
MSEFIITILDTDTSLAERAARRLQGFLKKEGVLARVQEATCYLEISRQGLEGKTPVICVNNINYQCKNLDSYLLAKFATWLSQNLDSHVTKKGYNERISPNIF